MATRYLMPDEVKKRLNLGATEHFRAVVTIVAREEYEESLESGLGLMRFLLQYQFSVADYRSRDDPDEGSTSGASEIAAFLFSGVERNSGWWVSEYFRATDFTYQEYWIRRFSSYADVGVSRA